MRSYSLYDKMIELYAQNPNPDEETIKRSINNYLRRKYPNKKIERILYTMVSDDTFKQQATNTKNLNKLKDFNESIIDTRIRNSAKNSIPIDINELDEIDFKALIRHMILSFGYCLLYTPPFSTDSLDFIAHRGNVKVAVYSIKASLTGKIGAKTVKQARYVANFYNCDNVILATNGVFDSKAIAEGEDIGITLLDRNKTQPLINDIIYNSKKEQKEFFLQYTDEKKNGIFMEKVIRFPKTKVQIVDIKYFISEGANHLSFKGKLINTGKKPVSNLELNVKLFNRQSDCIYVKNVMVKEDLTMSKEEVIFSFAFFEIPESEFKSICRYELTLNYKNVYKV